MVELVDDLYCNVITIPGKDNAPKHTTPYVLRGLASNVSDTTSSDACANIVTRSRAKIVLKGPEPSAAPSNPTVDMTDVGSTGKTSKLVYPTNAASYSILDQLQRTSAQITIFELLKISPAHREILNKALSEANVPKDLDLNRFQSMVGHLTSPHYLSFSEEDDHSLSHPHNNPLHIEVIVKLW